MPLRRQSANILYPFTPSAEPHRTLVEGLRDAFFLAKGVGTSGPYGDSSSSISTSEEEVYPIDRPYFTMLYELNIDALMNTYIFYIKAPSFWQRLTFEVPRNQGLIRVAATEDTFSFIIVDSDVVPSSITTTTEIWAEVEPTRTVYQLDEIRSIRLTNEYRDHNPVTRDSSIAAHPDDSVLLVSRTGDTLHLVDGYNCALSYDEDTTTLFIKGGPGLGKGLSDEIPWDTTAPDIFKGINTINGQNVDGNVDIHLGKSLRPVYNSHKLTMTIMEDQ